MKRNVIVWHLTLGAIVVACSSGGGSGFGDSGGGGMTGPDGSITKLPPADGGKGLNGNDGSVSMDAGFSTGPCTYKPGDTVDHDGDGWSDADGDCNDCNKFINPGAYDVPNDGIDEDCNGTPDDEPAGCDGKLASSAAVTTAGTDGAQAMDLCRNTTASPPLPMKTWGLISADYVLPDGSNTPQPAPASYSAMYGCSYDTSSFLLGFGILGPKYGTMNVPQQGSRMLGLSTGTARVPADGSYIACNDVGPPPSPGYDKCYVNGAPNGFPGQTPACPGVFFGQAHDGAALRLVIRVPTNAVTMSFDSNFFSYEFPTYVCSPYNDTYVVIMTPAPVGEPPTANDNIAFDSMGNIISVNAGFLTVCDPNSMAGTTTYPCPEGSYKLAGTGFGMDSTSTEKGGDGMDHASTDWLTTTVSVSALAGKQITLLFAVWDSTDGILDTTVLIDNLHWTFATGPNEVPNQPPPMTQPK